MLMLHFKNQAAEINSSVTLRWYGLFLSLTHVWTFLHWRQGDFFVNAQSNLNAEPLCFPFFADCDLWRAHLEPSQWNWVLHAYFGLAVVVAGLFCRRHFAYLAYGGLALLSLVKLVLHLSNYNFMGNYHYMIHWISFLFLFLPHKDLLIRFSLVGFYFSAGLLKINLDWLSGAAMISPPWLHGRMLIASLFYVLVLELVFAFGLLSKNRLWRRLCLLQFLVFHAFSWHIVGFFYPLVMFSLLSYFVLQEGQQTAPAPSSHRKVPRLVVVVLVLFAIAQGLPRLLSRDPSLTGAPRLMALNMFDAKTECHPLLVVHRKGQNLHLDRPLRQLGVRLACDPLVYLNQGYQLCRQNQKQPEFERLSLSLFSKRVTESQFHQVLSIADLCSLRLPLWAEFWRSP